MNILNAGNYLGKITNYGLVKTQTNKVMLVISAEIFETKTEVNFTHTISKESDNKRLFQTLQTCGYPDDDISPLAKGPSSNLLDMARTYKFVIKTSVFKDQTRNEIEWINLPGGALYNNLISESEAKNLFKQ